MGVILYSNVHYTDFVVRAICLLVNQSISHLITSSVHAGISKIIIIRFLLVAIELPNEAQ